MKTSFAFNPFLLKKYIILIIFIILAVQTAGCAFRITLVGDYDEITDQAVAELYKKTKVFFSKLIRASGQEASYKANKPFYEEVQGHIAALILRAEVTEKALKRNPLTKNFNDLQQQYDDLELLHKTMAEIALWRSTAEITEEQAEVLSRLHQRSMKMVLTSLEGISLAMAEKAINSAIDVVRTAINSAIGWKIL